MTLYALFATATGDAYTYEMIWGDWRRVYRDADACRLALEELRSLVDQDPHAPEGLEYHAREVTPDEDIGSDTRTGAATAADHLAAADTGGYADLSSGRPAARSQTA